MAEPGLSRDGVLARVADLMQRSHVAVDADIDLVRNVAADPMPGLRLLADELHQLAKEAEYQASRVEDLIE